MEWLELKVPPVGVGLAVVTSAWGSAKLDALSWSIPSWFQAATFMVMAAGMGVAVAGVISFGRARTTVNPHKPGNASTLVTSGIYRWTRNPMYLGMLLVLSGWALQWGGVLPILVTTLFVPYMNRFQIIPEERSMRELFGEEFDRYAVRVRRWI